MIHYLTSIIVAVVVFSLVTSPAFAATGDTLTIFTSHKSIPEGETFVLSGKLKDRNLNPIRNAEIIIWESDRTGNSHVGITTTNSNGEYRIVVTAKYWDGVGNSVEIFAFAGTHSIKSQEITINIVKPNSFNSGGSSVGTSAPSLITYIDTQLSLHITDSSSQGNIKVLPTLTYGSTNQLSVTFIKIYVDGYYKADVSSNRWSHDIWVGDDSHTIKASVRQFTDSSDSSIKYQPSSYTVNYFVKAVTSGGSGVTSGSGSGSGVTSGSGSGSGVTSGSGSGSGVTSGSGSGSGVTSSDSFPIGYVIVGVVVAAAAAGVGIALSKRKKAAPMVYASPANIPVAPTADDTQFWVCPNCGKDTQYKNGKQYCDSCKVYL